MEDSKSGTRRFGRCLALAIAAGFAAAAIMSLQGCCSTFCPCPVCPSTEHIVAIFEVDGMPCVAPGMTVAKRGEWVLFVNATPNTTTIQTPWDPPVFEGHDRDHPIVLRGNQSLRVTVSQQAPVHHPFTFVIEPKPTCPGYPGPGMDIDG